MATFQSRFRDTVLRAKNYAGCLGANLVDRANYGDDVKCGEKKLIFLTNLIETAEFHYCFNYDENGTIEDPDYTCLTQAQAQRIMFTLNYLMK